MMSDYEVIQHFARFFSPGTFTAETSSREIDRWDTEVAIKLMSEIKERYGATPYGFQFVTRGRKAGELDSKEIARSGTHYVDVKVETLDEVRARANPDERILLSNMEGNGWDKIVTTTKGWKWTQPLKEGDVVLESAA